MCVQKADEQRDAVKAYVAALTPVLNAANLSHYLTSFMERTDLSARLSDTLAKSVVSS